MERVSQLLVFLLLRALILLDQVPPDFIQPQLPPYWPYLQGWGRGRGLGLSNVSLREKETQSRLQQGRTNHQREKLKATDTYYLTFSGPGLWGQLSWVLCSPMS